MADPTPPTPPTAKTRAQKYDLVNPTRARRIIHDGIEGSHKAITVEPGETKRNVELSVQIADEIKKRTRPRGKEKSDLLVYAAGQAPDPSKNTSDADEDADDAE